MVTIMQKKPKKHQSYDGQKCSHCIEVDVGAGNEFTIRNLEMNLTFDEEHKPEFQDDGEEFSGDFQGKGSEKAMQDFFRDPIEAMHCIILVKSGTLILEGCKFSLNGLAHYFQRRKVPCITVLDLQGSNSSAERTKLHMKECKLKGDDLTNEKTWTAGILSVDSDIRIVRSHFENFKSGAIMLQAKEGNSVKVEENQIMSCDTNGIYVQGKQS